MCIRDRAKEAKKRRKRAQRALEERDWKRLEPELARCQLESQKVIAAIEKQSWKKEEAAMVGRGGSSSDDRLQGDRNDREEQGQVAAGRHLGSAGDRRGGAGSRGCLLDASRWV